MEIAPHMFNNRETIVILCQLRHFNPPPFKQYYTSVFKISHEYKITLFNM